MRRSVGLTLVLLGAVLAVTWFAAGWSAVVLASPSMAPWASAGSLLLHRHVPASQIEVGDVVTVQDAAGRLPNPSPIVLGDSAADALPPTTTAQVQPWIRHD